MNEIKPPVEIYMHPDQYELLRQEFPELKSIDDLVDYMQHPDQVAKPHRFVIMCDKQWEQLQLIDKRAQHWYWRAWYWLCNPFGWRN